MNIHNIAWLTDIHINFLEVQERNQFYQKVIDANCDAILITGDIAEGHNIAELLVEFLKYIIKPIFFVLGNHDYYFESARNVEQVIKQLCKNHSQLHWLQTSDVIPLNSNTGLLGVDGWADARLGNFERSTINLNDSRLIAELLQAKQINKGALKSAMQKLADKDAQLLNEKLARLKQHFQKIIIGTHIPPFADCCRYKGKQSDENWLPYFSSKATGDVIEVYATDNPNIELLVLCGHTHAHYTGKILPNLEVRVGKAEYYYPDVQEIISL